MRVFFCCWVIACVICLNQTQDLDSRKLLLYYFPHGFPCKIDFQPFSLCSNFFWKSPNPLPLQKCNSPSHLSEEIIRSVTNGKKTLSLKVSLDIRHKMFRSPQTNKLRFARCKYSALLQQARSHTYESFRITLPISRSHIQAWLLECSYDMNVVRSDMILICLFCGLKTV